MHRKTRNGELEEVSVREKSLGNVGESDNLRVFCA